jgi:hypothetical protein
MWETIAHPEMKRVMFRSKATTTEKWDLWEERKG